MALGVAFLMMITSVGFTLNLHYCGDKVKSFSLLGKAQSCHDVAAMASSQGCAHSAELVDLGDTLSLNQKNCCQNKIVTFYFDQDSKISATEYILGSEMQSFLVAFVSIILTNNQIEDIKPQFALYKPPLIEKDIPVLIQSFLL